MLILKDKISAGMVRDCYLHPHDSEKCVKVVKYQKDIRSLYGELRIFDLVKEQLSSFICHYENELVKTDKGDGLVMELVRDEDGGISQRLETFMNSQPIDKNIRQQFDDFFAILLENRFYFTDFNLHNFLVVQQKEQPQIKYIDLKSYKAVCSTMKLEVVFPFLWRAKTIRRMNRFYERII